MTPAITPAPDRAALAAAIAEAVKAVPGIERLTGGNDVEVATQFAGGKVLGVRLRETVEVHVVANKMPLPPVAEKTATAARVVLAQAGDTRPVEVFIDDFEGI